MVMRTCTTCRSNSGELPPNFARLPDGASLIHVTGRTVISKDGKTMTTTTKGTNEEGKKSSGKFIYEKQ